MGGKAVLENFKQHFSVIRISKLLCVLDVSQNSSQVLFNIGAIAYVAYVLFCYIVI